MRVRTTDKIGMIEVKNLLNVGDFLNLYDNLNDFIYALWADDQLTDEGYDEIKEAVSTCFKNNKLLKGYREFTKHKKHTQKQKEEQLHVSLAYKNLPLYEQHLCNTEETFNTFWNNIETDSNLDSWQKQLSELPNLTRVLDWAGIPANKAYLELPDIDGRNNLLLQLLPISDVLNQSKEYPEYYILITDRATDAFVQFYIKAEGDILSILNKIKDRLPAVAQEAIIAIKEGAELNLNSVIKKAK